MYVTVHRWFLKDFKLYFCFPDALVFQIMQGPLSIFGGIGFGILWGLLARYVPEKQDVSSVVLCFPQCSCYDECKRDGHIWSKYCITSSDYSKDQSNFSYDTHTVSCFHLRIHQEKQLKNIKTGLLLLLLLLLLLFVLLHDIYIVCPLYFPIMQYNFYSFCLVIFRASNRTLSYYHTKHFL